MGFHLEGNLQIIRGARVCHLRQLIGLFIDGKSSARIRGVVDPRVIPDPLRCLFRHKAGEFINFRSVRFRARLHIDCAVGAVGPIAFKQVGEFHGVGLIESSAAEIRPLNSGDGPAGLGTLDCHHKGFGLFGLAL